MTAQNEPAVTLERIVEQGPDPVIFADLEGIIRVWNAAATRLFGHTRDEAVGQTLDLIIPERFREQHWTGYDRALAAHATKYTGQALTTRSMRKDGTTIYIEMTFAIILDDTGDSLGALAFARDVTERFERERAQRAQARAEAPAP
ncbi:MAG: PAS domain S-box protein [Dehalococcoidia bacterium]|nr:PAS domain S-box protein [Dehalococcoidia bacterium]